MEIAEVTEDQRFSKAKKIGSGTYGVVYSAKDNILDCMVAVKKIKLDNEEEGIPSTTLRELSLLQQLEHENIVKLLDIDCEENRILLIFELCKMDLKNVIYDGEGPKLTKDVVKKIMRQLLEAIKFCHEEGTFHRDLKPNNILLDDNYNVKVADFGLARAFNLPMKEYTHEVVTLWYRAPEILMGDNNYSIPIDIWAIGIIFFELIHGHPIFHETSEIGVLFKIFQVWGTPTNSDWEGVEDLRFYSAKFPKFKASGVDDKLCKKFDDLEMDLFSKMIALNPINRISAKAALDHEYFMDC